MGTNYYYFEEIDTCKHCKRPKEIKEIHIGKRSCGWNFLFDNYCKTYKEWVEFIKEHDGHLYDEYDRNIPAKEFIEDIFETKGKRHLEFSTADGEYDISNHRDFS